MQPKVQAQTVFRVSAERAFDVFADAEQMSRFWFYRRDTGFQEGKTLKFFMGPEPGAPSFDVRVTEIKRPTRLALEWGEGEARAAISWTFEEKGPDATLVAIEETGHRLAGEALMARLLDSTGGFNQVIIAAKALAEHDVALNVVSDHA